jgi:hypothetical protein
LASVEATVLRLTPITLASQATAALVGSITVAVSNDGCLPILLA